LLLPQLPTLLCTLRTFHTYRTHARGRLPDRGRASHIFTTHTLAHLAAHPAACAGHTHLYVPARRQPATRKQHALAQNASRAHVAPTRPQGGLPAHTRYMLSVPSLVVTRGGMRMGCETETKNACTPQRGMYVQACSERARHACATAMSKYRFAHTQHYPQRWRARLVAMAIIKRMPLRTARCIARHV